MSQYIVNTEIKEIQPDNVNFLEMMLDHERHHNTIFPELVTVFGYSMINGLDKSEKIYMAYVDGEAVSTMTVGHIDGKTAEVMRVYTKKEFRGKGFASMLLETVLEYTKSVGYTGIFLDVLKGNIPAINLYAKYGFTCIEIEDDEKMTELFGVERKCTRNEIDLIRNSWQFMYKAL
jgi:ribosomal protein S18 acetylase RimI-like enzyme